MALGQIKRIAKRDMEEALAMSGLLAPQKSVQPMAAQPAQPASNRLGFADFEKALGYSLTQGGQGVQAGTMNALAQFAGNPGAFQTIDFMSEGANESGSYGSATTGNQLDPAFIESLRNGGYGFEIDRSGRHPEARMYDAQGQMLGRQFSVGDTGSKFDNFMDKAVPIGLSLLAGGALGGFIPGVPGIPGLVAGAGGGAGAAAGVGAADIGALGLAEGVYGAGGALGAGVAPGTVGGLAGSTAGFGGLGSVLPAGVGFAAPAALGSGATFDLSTVGGPDPAGLVPSTPQPVEFGGQGLLGEPTFTPSLSGGLEPFVQQLPTIGAEATAFGGLPELSALGAGAPMTTPFGGFGGGLLAPEVAAASAVTQPAAPSVQFDPGAMPNANPLGGGLAPTLETLPAIGAETTAFGGLPQLNALANGAAAATPLGSFALPPATQGGLSGLLGTAKDAAAWMKQNPMLGRLLTAGATTALSGMGGGGGGSAAAAAPVGPPVQWNSGLQQGLLAPVQQYAPAAVQQNRPAGLLAQGFANDGAWRYLGG